MRTELIVEEMKSVLILLLENICEIIGKLLSALYNDVPYAQKFINAFLKGLNKLDSLTTMRLQNI